MSLPQSDSPPSLDVASLLPGWKQSAVTGTIGGMLAVKVIEAVTKTDFEIAIKSNKLVNISHMRDQSRFARLTRSFRVGGVLGGVSMVTLSGVLNYLNEKRGVVDVHNFAASGAVAGGAYGLMAHRRVLPAMALSVFYGVISYTMGSAFLKLLEKQRDDLLKQIKEKESQQCDEARMKD